MYSKSKMHSLVIIVVPHKLYELDPEFISKYIDHKMAKYNESLELDPHIEMTKSELEKDYEEFRKSASAESLKKFDNIDKYRNDYLGISDGLVDSDGNVYSTSNSDAEYDWYSIGGRFNGWFNGSHICDDSCDEDENIKTNSIKISDFISKISPENDDYIYYKIVDRSGTFFSHDNPSSFGCEDEITDDAIIDKKWRETYEKILHYNVNDYLVALDCHF